MNISEALNAAADHIEAHPDRYNFMVAHVPSHDTDNYMPYACMLGRFGQLAGLPAGFHVEAVASMVLGKSAIEFYKEICDAGRIASGHLQLLDATALVPSAMREVAKKYEGIPDSVRDIFNAKINALVAGVPS